LSVLELDHAQKAFYGFPFKTYKMNGFPYKVELFSGEKSKAYAEI